MNRLDQRLRRLEAPYTGAQMSAAEIDEAVAAYAAHPHYGLIDEYPDCAEYDEARFRLILEKVLPSQQQIAAHFTPLDWALQGNTPGYPEYEESPYPARSLCRRCSARRPYRFPSCG